MNRSFVKTFFAFFGIAASEVLMKPSVAAAHLVTTGMGPVYDGIGHLLLTPDDLIPVMACAFYAGLRGKETGRWVLFLFPLSWFAGGMAGLLVNNIPAFPLAAFSFLILGGLIAADLRLPVNVVTGIIMAVGIMHGFFNGTALQEGPGVSGLIGIMAMLFILVAITSAFIVSLRRVWTRVAVRVAGSWIAAIGLLMLGWLAKGKGWS